MHDLLSGIVIYFTAFFICVFYFYIAGFIVYWRADVVLEFIHMFIVKTRNAGEDRAHLRKSTKKQDCLQMFLPCTRLPIKLNWNLINNDNQYNHLQAKDELWRLSESYQRKDDQCCIHRINYEVLSRFVELLSPHTLYFYSLSSKSVFYDCLNIRGLGFTEVLFPTGVSGYYRVATNFEPFGGMLSGSVTDKRFVFYQACYGCCHIALSEYLEHPEYCLFVKKYRTLRVFLEQELLDTGVEDFCQAISHPGVKQLFVCLRGDFSVENNASLSALIKFLELWTHVESMNVTFPYKSTGFRKTAILKDNPPFAEIKAAVENWALTAANLKQFFFEYKSHIFQWHEKRLKRCVKIGSWYLLGMDSEWFWTDQCDIDNNRYMGYEELELMDEYDSNSFTRMIDAMNPRKRTMSIREVINCIDSFFDYRYYNAAVVIVIVRFCLIAELYCLIYMGLLYFPILPWYTSPFLYIFF